MILTHLRIVMKQFGKQDIILPFCAIYWNITVFRLSENLTGGKQIAVKRIECG